MKRIIRLVKDFYSAIKDPERLFSERLFLLLTLISEISVLIALIGDIITGESIYEIILIIGVLIFVPTIVIICFYKDKLNVAIRVIVLGLVFLIVPGLYLLGGGVEGGGVLWVIFSFLYIGMVLSGKWRNVLLGILVVITVILYTIQYFNPEIISIHLRPMFYTDSFISLIMVGVVCFVMTKYQTRLFELENERARKEAEKAEELTRAQNRFFSSMSHEIRTPINSILGLNELILRDQNTSEEVLKDAMGIQGAGKLLLALINDILDFSKMEAGSMDIVPVDYHIGDMISEVVSMIWIKANEKGLKFDVRVDPNMPSVLYGDEVRIKQIIINLLNNAVKYTPNGSVGLAIESTESEEEGKVLVTISISDTGMGIKKEALPYLFDAFKRVDEEKNRHIEGTGLGLSIVKQLIDLMDGSVNVSSVYGEGSTFTVVLKQGVSNSSVIGELNIQNYGSSNGSRYESSFRAPEAKILIVDDNEMNLEVEKKLLADTDMTIDTVLSGKEALQMTLKNRYDVILMDHLMPEMDGIVCLERIRNQSGGLNRNTHVIVLTANAGSDNRELYNRSGFDGYLVKPVSGEKLENALVRHIPREKLYINSKSMTSKEDINTAVGYARKIPVVITATSMCDLPDAIVKNLNLNIIPFKIKTDEGVFKDGVQMGADELIRYMASGKNAVSAPPDIEEYTDFFAETLKHAHHLIHIAITTSMSEDYNISTEAAKAFDNVSVINSGVLSSATGILVLIAHKLTQLKSEVPEIVEELEIIKERLKCSFVIDNTEYMAQRGLISSRIHRIARTLELHPSLKFDEDKSGIGGIWMGSTRRAYKRYIHKAFPVDVIPDSEVVFITYVDLPEETLLWIKEEISKIAYFERVVFKQASAAISSNCGAGTFGILYFVKSNKSYNIGGFIPEELESGEEHIGENAKQKNDEAAAGEDDRYEDNYEDTEEDDAAELPDDTDNSIDVERAEWYHNIPGIIGNNAIANSGSEDALKTVLKIFYDSLKAKYEELENYYLSEDWENYTIKIHALKSSAKLIGAMKLSEDAQKLESAGKSGDIDYIKEHYDAFMSDYAKYSEYLREVCGDKEDAAKDKPMADEAMIKGAYETIIAAAEDIDSDVIEDTLEELSEYKIPESEKDKIAKIKECADRFDFETILELLRAD